jgi:hypothetical protein
MYATSLRKALHTRRFTIRTVSASGWEVCDENDGGVVKHVVYTDWHRVERALAMFRLEADTLRSVGWIDEPTI